MDGKDGMVYKELSTKMMIMVIMMATTTTTMMMMMTKHIQSPHHTPGSILSPFHVLTYLILTTIPGSRYQLSLEAQVQTDHSMHVQEVPSAGCGQVTVS